MSGHYQQQKAWAQIRVARLAEERQQLQQERPLHTGNCYACAVRADAHDEFGCNRFTRGPHG